MKAILSGDPNLIYFVYGPINSGKTALLMKVFEDLPDNYCVFYINFRWRYVADIDDLLQVLFEIRQGDFKEILKDLLKESVRTFREFKGIPIPEKMFELIFGKAKVGNIFGYLEEVFEKIKEAGKVPVFVLDEMQSIKRVINASGKPVIQELFNFLVALTKEKHLCHCLCATSDCLFIESVYSNARLEGRSQYILVNDLSKNEAFEVYDGFGFNQKELVWRYIGGRVGDMVGLYERKKRGIEEKKALKEMLKNEIRRLEWIKLTKLSEKEDGEEIWEFLEKFKHNKLLSISDVKDDFERVIFWIEENVLFYNPVDGTIKPQSPLIGRAIKSLN